jgi:hypothetical protein
MRTACKSSLYPSTLPCRSTLRPCTSCIAEACDRYHPRSFRT